jgi:hypothetical protein
MNDVLIRIWLQKRNILFRNPNVAEGQTEPNVTFRDEYVYGLSALIKYYLLMARAV